MHIVGKEAFLKLKYKHAFVEIVIMCGTSGICF